jgi:hypothetical protein
MWAGSWETVIILAKPVIARTPTLDRWNFDFPLWRLERVSGIEPPPSAWKAEVLPLNYTRLSYLPPPLKWWRGKDSNLRRHSQQIYSLPPLTAWVPLRGQEPAIVLRDSRGVNGFSASKRRPDVFPAAFSSRGRPRRFRNPAFDGRPAIPNPPRRHSTPDRSPSAARTASAATAASLSCYRISDQALRDRR